MPAPTPSASTPTPPASTPTPLASPPTPTDAAPARAPRRTGRLLAGTLAAAVAATAVVSFGDLRDADVAAAATAERTAAAELVGSVTSTRLAMDDHARTADDAAAASLRHHAAVVAGGSHDPDVVAAHVEDLRATADTLTGLAEATPPERPGPVPVADADPILERYVQAQDQAAELAVTLERAADEAAATDAALAELRAASSAYADDSSLTGSDDPEAVAAAWREERQTLTSYRERLDAVDTDALDLSPLLAAQYAFIGALEDVADRAIELLDDGDLDGYAALLDDELGGDDLLGAADALRDGRDAVTAELLRGPRGDARARALGLRVELGVLRDALPDLLND